MNNLFLKLIKVHNEYYFDTLPSETFNLTTFHMEINLHILVSQTVIKLTYNFLVGKASKCHSAILKPNLKYIQCQF